MYLSYKLYKIRFPVHTVIIWFINAEKYTISNFAFLDIHMNPKQKELFEYYGYFLK